jgi:hypothetical protein
MKKTDVRHMNMDDEERQERHDPEQESGVENDHQ